MGSYCMPDTSDGQLPGCQPRGQDLAGAEYIHEQPLSSLLELMWVRPMLSNTFSRPHSHLGDSTTCLFYG